MQKAIFEEVQAELVAEGVAVSDNIEVGMMVEIPAAVLADQFTKYGRLLLQLYKRFNTLWLLTVCHVSIRINHTTQVYYVWC